LEKNIMAGSGRGKIILLGPINAIAAGRLIPEKAALRLSDSLTSNSVQSHSKIRPRPDCQGILKTSYLSQPGDNLAKSFKTLGKKGD
jgi:hypothetical protein